ETFDNEKNTERDYQELNDNINEVTIVNSCFGYFIGFICWLDDVFHFGEIDTARSVTDGWHDDIIDQRGHDFAKGPADDNADSKVHHAAAHGEFLEFFNKTHKTIRLICQLNISQRLNWTFSTAKQIFFLIKLNGLLLNLI